VTGAVTRDKLPQLLDAYAALAAKTDYRAVFPWIDNIAEIHDKRLATKLDEAVVTALRSGSPKVWLGLPQVVEWKDIAGFVYRRGKSASVCDELSLELYSLENGSVTDMTLTRLDADVIRCVSTQDGSDLWRWTVRKCLVGEVEFNGETFVISEGHWFRVDRDFLQKIDSDVAAIPRRYAGVLPKFNGTTEGEYNIRTARRSKGAFHLLDTDLVQFAPRGSVEICDLYDRDRVFVHIKRYGGSSVLSHLFAQGAVSAELFYFEPTFRKAVWEKLPAPYQWGDPIPQPTRDQFGVCFGVICRPGKGLDLPVFSKVNLRKEARHLTQLGFEVWIAEIPS
jgi:uncharacterized protein (TIGR04141 family)